MFLTLLQSMMKGFENIVGLINYFLRRVIFVLLRTIFCTFWLSWQKALTSSGGVTSQIDGSTKNMNFPFIESNSQVPCMLFHSKPPPIIIISENSHSALQISYRYTGIQFNAIHHIAHDYTANRITIAQRSNGLIIAGPTVRN